MVLVTFPYWLHTWQRSNGISPCHLVSLGMVLKLPMSSAAYLVWFYLLLLLLVSWLLLCSLLTILFVSSRSGAGDLLDLDFSSDW